MGDVLLVLVIVCLAVVGGCLAVVIAVLHGLTVQNRVVAGHASPAPLSWLVAPDLAARLHRRLRAAIALAGAASGPTADDLGLFDVIAKLRARAIELDDQLVIAARAPKPARRRMLRELQSEVAELERLAERTVRMSRAWTGTAPSERGLSAVRERLELLEAALRELDGLEVGRPADPVRPALRRGRQA